MIKNALNVFTLPFPLIDKATIASQYYYNDWVPPLKAIHHLTSREMASIAEPEARPPESRRIS